MSRFVVCAAMRNEGPFIVEWVCWYRMLGFEALVVTNDCTDHSVELLEALQSAGLVTHKAHTPGPGQLPKPSAYNCMRTHPVIAEVDWVLVCDVDEFLVLHQGNTIGEYVAHVPGSPLGIAFHWRVFGTSGRTVWADEPAHRMFVKAADRELRVNTPFKSMFRNPTRFGRFSDHSPTLYADPWDLATEPWVDSNGRPLRRLNPTLDRPQKATAPERVRHRNAQMNHYMVRSDENFALKRGTLSPSGGVDRYTDHFFDRNNRNENPDVTALRFSEQFDAQFSHAMSQPDVHRLHHLCCLDLVNRIAAHTGTDPQNDPRWHHHRAQADRGVSN